MTFDRAAILAAAIAVALPGAALAQSTYNWSGAYVGATVGTGLINSAVDSVSFYDDVDGLEYSGGLPGFSYNGAGIIGGGEFGYNWQSGGMVVGVEGDVSASNASASYTDLDHNFMLNTKLNWLSTARLRIGLPMDNILVYGTGGVAFAQVQTDLTDNYPGDSTVYNLSNTQSVVGWTVGAGIAAAINQHWVVKAEYLYADLGSHTFSYSEDPTGDIGWPLVSSPAKITSSVIRAGVAYKF
jgi:outer membrane immunogenic protein